MSNSIGNNSGNNSSYFTEWTEQNELSRSSDVSAPNPSARTDQDGQTAGQDGQTGRVLRSARAEERQMPPEIQSLMAAWAPCHRPVPIVNFRQESAGTILLRQAPVSGVCLTPGRAFPGNSSRGDNIDLSLYQPDLRMSPDIIYGLWQRQGYSGGSASTAAASTAAAGSEGQVHECSYSSFLTVSERPTQNPFIGVVRVGNGSFREEAYDVQINGNGNRKVLFSLFKDPVIRIVQDALSNLFDHNNLDEPSVVVKFSDNYPRYSGIQVSVFKIAENDASKIYFVSNPQSQSEEFQQAECAIAAGTDFEEGRATSGLPCKLSNRRTFIPILNPNSEISVLSGSVRLLSRKALNVTETGSRPVEKGLRGGGNSVIEIYGTLGNGDPGLRSHPCRRRGEGIGEGGEREISSLPVQEEAPNRGEMSDFGAVKLDPLGSLPPEGSEDVIPQTIELPESTRGLTFLVKKIKVIYFTATRPDGDHLMVAEAALAPLTKRIATGRSYY